MTPDQFAQLQRVLSLQEDHPFLPPVRAELREGQLCLWMEDRFTRLKHAEGGFWGPATPELIATALQTRERMLQQNKQDPLRHLIECDMWRRTDLMVARKRLKYPGAVLRLLVTGGIRSGKTEGSTRRVNANFFYTPNAWVWFTHETETTSKAIQQRRVHRFIPPEIDTDSGKLRATKNITFSFKEGTGFSDNKFHFKWNAQNEDNQPMLGGGLGEFRFYKAARSTFQGSELTGANSDELTPVEIVKDIDERLNSRAEDTRNEAFLARIRRAVEMLEAGRTLPAPLLGALYHGVHILSFTPKEGWSATVATMLDGARTIEEEPADPDLLPGKMVPRFKQPVNDTWIVAYFHTADNPKWGNFAGLKQSKMGASEEDIRISFYGDVQKNWSVTFVPPFEARHHVITDRKFLPRKGTFRFAIDPARARPWCIGLFLTDPLQRRYLVREWPQAGSNVPTYPCRSLPSQGDPGMWAVTSEKNKINGDPGPAQDLKLGWGYDPYTRELWSLLMEAGEWWFTPEEQAAHRVTITWERYPDWTLTGSPVPLYDTFADPRFSKQTGTGAAEEVDLIDGMEAASSAYNISGEGRFAAEHSRRAMVPILPKAINLDLGDQLLINALGGYDTVNYDPQKPDMMNTPNFRLWHECKSSTYTLQTFSIAPFRSDSDKKDEACKDQRDVMVLHESMNPTHYEPVPQDEATLGGW